MQSVCFGLLVPFLGTSLGVACVFFLRTLNETVEKILLGFAAGVMVAASVWSLLLPAIDGSRRWAVWHFCRRRAALPWALRFAAAGPLFARTGDHRGRRRENRHDGPGYHTT